MALLVYTPQLNSRIAYSFQHLFENILGVSIAFTQVEETFKTFEDAKISYSPKPLGNEIHFTSHPFILEQGIKKQNLAFADVEGLKLPFPVVDSVFPVDVFAAAFYFLSRYEEYVMEERDEHGRFSAKSSLAFKNDFLYQPLIDEWAYQIADLLKRQFADFRISERKFYFQPTIDIDRPYFYLTDSYFKQKAKKIRYQLQSDPFDIYNQISEWDLQYGNKTIFFFLVGNQHENDPAPEIDHPLYKSVIEKVSELHPVGIHPSYFSHLNTHEVKREKKLLVITSQRKISISRQHYLLLSFPKTYRNLIEADIKEDYTLAFADVPGFRASTCTPFFWYDLEKEEITGLLVHPTTVMDQSLKKYMGLSPQEAITLIEKLMNKVKKVNGDFISLWHNESVNDFNTWKGWKKVYIKMLELAQKSSI
ncbi:MAG: polysaccharide deacetylase family protein [Sphingobacteriales bacterium]|nr:polysaccharide deacetylase family protein [Sphingobacteriales bacterium]